MCRRKVGWRQLAWAVRVEEEFSEYRPEDPWAEVSASGVKSPPVAQASDLLRKLAIGEMGEAMPTLHTRATADLARFPISHTVQFLLARRTIALTSPSDAGLRRATGCDATGTRNAVENRSPAQCAICERPLSFAPDARSGREPLAPSPYPSLRSDRGSLFGDVVQQVGELIGEGEHRPVPGGEVV
jgi:hypothetical protein